MNTAPSSVVDPDLQAHHGEARLLAELLRTSRLALLYAEAGTDKSAFLKSVLMPLLSRRTSDRFGSAAARESGVVVPFPDRRKRPAATGSKRKREFVVHFDRWTEAPLPALLARIHEAAHTCDAERAASWQSLGDTLDALCNRLDASFIVLLDRFEDFVQAPPAAEGHAEFTNQWIDALGRVRLPVSFLVSVNEEARPRLDGLRRRIAGFDDLSLKLTPPPGLKATTPPPRRVEPVATAEVIEPPLLTDVATAPEATSASAGAGATASAPPSHRASSRTKIKRPVEPKSEVQTKDVYALIEATLARTVTEVSVDPFPDGEPAPETAHADRLVSSPPDAVAAPAQAGSGRPAGLLARMARLLHLPFGSARNR